VVDDNTESAEKRFHVDERYSAFHLRPTPVSWWDYMGGRWMVSGYEEVASAARDPETFCSRHDLPNGSSPYAGVMTPSTPVRAVPIEVDPPDYLAYRRLLGPRFTPAAIRAMRPRVDQFIDWCIDRHIRDGRMDLFQDLAKLVPAMTTMELIGLPAEDAEIVADAVHVRGEDRFSLKPPWALLYKRTSEAIAARRVAPTDDLISLLLSAELDGERFTDMELFELCFTVVVGGMATTARLTLGALSYLAERPDQRELLRADRSLIPHAVEEFLRYYSPVPFLSRTAARDVCFGEQEIRAGDRVALGFAAANRDPKVFEDPDTIKFDRPAPIRHLALGHGLHFCIGGLLGKMEAAAMIGRVLDRLPDYAIADFDRNGMPTALAGNAEGERLGADWEIRTKRGLPVEFTPGEPVGVDIGFTELNQMPAMLQIFATSLDSMSGDLLASASARGTGE
jgi:cytochrome P450